MNRPRICAVIIDANVTAIKDAEPLVDLFEVRIDLIGEGWPAVARQLGKPWIACNRLVEEGGLWHDSEARRIEKLLQAVEMGASMVDIELRTRNLENVVAAIKRRTRCMISSHDLDKTPDVGELRSVVNRQIKAGADVCKLVTTARGPEDNLTVLRLVAEGWTVPLVAFAMGPSGVLSRVLAPLAGADFTYAAVAPGKVSAAGQMTAADLREVYRTIGI